MAVNEVKSRKRISHKKAQNTQKFFCALCAFLWLIVPVVSGAQNLPDVVKRGEEIFSQSCTGYCHASKGGGGGSAPRLAARGFDQAYINNVVTRGIPGTAMQGFGMTLSRADLIAVIAYVATLNGIANPTVAPPSVGAPDRPLPPEAARGRDLFYDATRKRLFVTGGDGFADVVQEVDPGHFSRVVHLPTAAGARTSLFVPMQNRLYVAVPHRGNQRSEIRIYESRS